jgi:hypothetical protein
MPEPQRTVIGRKDGEVSGSNGQPRAGCRWLRRFKLDAGSPVWRPAMSPRRGRVWSSIYDDAQSDKLLDRNVRYMYHTPHRHITGKLRLLPMPCLSHEPTRTCVESMMHTLLGTGTVQKQEVREHAERITYKCSFTNIRISIS